MIFLFPKLSPVHWRLQQNCDKAFSRNHAIGIEQKSDRTEFKRKEWKEGRKSKIKGQTAKI